MLTVQGHTSGMQAVPGLPSLPASSAGLRTSSHPQRCVATDTAWRGRCQTTDRDGQGINACRVGRKRGFQCFQTITHSAAELEEMLCPSCLPPASSWGWDNSSQGSMPSPGSVTQVTQRWIRVGFRARLEGAASGNARAQRSSSGWSHGGAGDGDSVGTRQSWGCGAGSVLPPAGGWEAELTSPPFLTPGQMLTAANLPSPPPGRNSISDPSTPGELTL